jgi:tetratricopeptide (TPR) repeat protein
MPSTICSACGIVFQEGKRYCRACGAPLRLKYALLPYVVSSCKACTVQYVVERRECALCGQLVARPVEQVVGVGSGAVVSEESPANARLLSQDAFQTYAGSSGAGPKAPPSLPGSFQRSQPAGRQLACLRPDSLDRSDEEPHPRVGWTFLLLLIVGLGMAGVLAGMVLVMQFRAQPEAPPLTPQLTLLESNQVEDRLQRTKSPRSTRSNKADAHNAHGVELAGAGTIEAAITEFRRAVAVDPRNFKAHNNLGVLYQQKGFVPQAIGEYGAASRAEPGHPVPYKNMAILNEERSQLREALQNYSRYLEIAPNAADGETIRRKIRELRGKVDNPPNG